MCVSKDWSSVACITCWCATHTHCGKTYAAKLTADVKLPWQKNTITLVDRKWCFFYNTSPPNFIKPVAVYVVCVSGSFSPTSCL